MRVWHKFLIVCCSMLFLLVGCKAATESRTIDGVEYLFDYQNHTIQNVETKDLIQFEVGDSQYTVIYPDGSSYSAEDLGGVFASGGSADYQETKYGKGDLLIEPLMEHQSQAPAVEIIWFSVIAGLIGLFNLLVPYPAWYLSYGWRYQDAKPSGMALGVVRIGGAALLLVAILVWFYPF